MGKAEKVLTKIIDAWPRWAGVDRMPAGPLAGPPGSGKTTFLKALYKIAVQRGIDPLWIQTKDCNERSVVIKGAKANVIRRISATLQFSSSDGFRPAFDLLTTASVNDLTTLSEWVERKLRPDVATWIIARLEVLSRFIHDDDVVIPTCLQQEDEINRRIVIGLLYVLRPYIPVPLIIDDVLSFIINREYADAFIAMSRPFLITLNRYLETRELLSYSPIVVTPDRSGGLYRLAIRDKYVVLTDFGRFELPLREVLDLAEGV